MPSEAPVLTAAASILPAVLAGATRGGGTVNMGMRAPGALVSVRGAGLGGSAPREAEVICLRPVDGSKLDAIGSSSRVDGGDVESATYPRPDPSAAGDFTGTRLVHDTVRLNLRSGAGPFRSLHRLSVEPRPYQYVLLLMALRLDPVRLLIADDVSVGKTIDAGHGRAGGCSIAGPSAGSPCFVPRTFAINGPKSWCRSSTSRRPSCSPPTMARLERGLPPGHIGVFRHYPHLVASIDFVKSDRWRRSFIDDCPDFLIVDEAHTAAAAPG